MQFSLPRTKKPNALDAPMLPAELEAARVALGVTQAQLADQLNVTRYELDAFASGRKKLPTQAAWMLRMLVAERRRADALAASGLPECDEAQRLARDVEVALALFLDDDHALPRSDRQEVMDAARSRLDAHPRRCEACRARADWQARPAPPMPALPGDGWFMGAIMWLGESAGGLPSLLRVPRGARGDGRRMGLMLGGLSSSFALLPLGMLSVKALVGGEPMELLQYVLVFMGIVAMQLLVGFACGWAWDVLSPLRGRFAGYLLRGALTAGVAGAIYGVVFAITEGKKAAPDFGFAAVVAVVGAVVGTIMWVVDRVRGKLTRRTRSLAS